MGDTQEFLLLDSGKVEGTEPPGHLGGLQPGMYKENLMEVGWFSMGKEERRRDLISVSKKLMALAKVEVHEGETKCTRHKSKDSKLY